MTRVCFALQAVVSAEEDNSFFADTRPLTARVGCEGGARHKEDQYAQAPRTFSFVRGQTSEPLTMPGLLGAGENSACLVIVRAHLRPKNAP